MLKTGSINTVGYILYRTVESERKMFVYEVCSYTVYLQI